MKLHFKGTTNAKDIWIKSIMFETAEYGSVTIDRNITNYVVDNGYFEMTWTGCFVPGKHNNYSIRASELAKAQLTMVNVHEEYASLNYQIHISEWSASE